MSVADSIQRIETEAQYDLALRRIDELLPMVSDDTPVNDPASIELMKISKLVGDYEDIHYPIGKEVSLQVDYGIFTEPNNSSAIVPGL